ncbi:acyl-CoA dehydrogenase family protein [Pseudomonas sp. GD03860]|uniref:acyl-CoA dehydrogenase family protein n=1 Tax=Pseudomonas TaxID=286 RepID=UPI0023636D37|nr:MULTISPECIES: acyl-CoA dehydrogenase family protein [Pseudomonas]MDD2058665.1 acyl-CoA dehydrogenase family protein [Pseudomonas putida]MDH0636898.1 acyl-CoA dehydrogenase family protein [Pseudomonas sp. GD03860]
MDTQRTLYREDHELFRIAVRRFLERDYLPLQGRCRGTGALDRQLWLKAGRQGLLCVTLPAQYGGGGDFGHAAIIREEFARLSLHDQALFLHSDIVAPCICSLASDEQKQRWLPGICSGELILALAWAGPDSPDGQVQARAQREQDHYRIDGSACSMGNVADCDLLLLACPVDGEGGEPGVSLFIVETQRPGVALASRARASSSGCPGEGELRFDQVCVPHANRLGAAGTGQDSLDQALQHRQLLATIFAASELEQLLGPALGQAQQAWDPYPARQALASIKTRALSLGHDLARDAQPVLPTRQDIQP